MVTLRERRPKAPLPPPTKKSSASKKSAAAAARKHNKKSAQNQRLRRKCKPHFLLDETGDQVWITQATLQDIHDAQKRGKLPVEIRKRKQLVTVPSASVRQAIYQRAAVALADLESKLLPTYGGRPWKCTVRVQEPAQLNQHASSKRKGHSSTPYFLWRPNGTLELAAWPHLVEKIPTPPNFPGFSKGNSSKRQQQQLQEEETNMTHAPPDEEDEDVAELQEREPCVLSRLAYQERFNTPLPVITMKWCSPLREFFTSRKAAWEHAISLCNQEVAIDKVLHGYGANGKPIKIYRPSKTAALKVGKWRFQRDGLWIVGQEEAWQRERLRQEGLLLEGDDENEEETKLELLDDKNPNKEEKDQDEGDKSTKKPRRLTGLCYYLQFHRKEHKQRRLAELKQQAKSRPSVIMDVEEAMHGKCDVAVPGATAVTNPPAAQEEGISIEQHTTAMNASSHEIHMDTKEPSNLTKDSLTPTIRHLIEHIDMDRRRSMHADDLIDVERRNFINEDQLPRSHLSSTPLAEGSAVVLEISADTWLGKLGDGRRSRLPCPSEERPKEEAIGERVAIVDAKSGDEPTKVSSATRGDCAPNPSINPLAETSFDTQNLETMPKRNQKPSLVSFTLRDAERELREVWKTLSKEVRLSWSNRAKEFETSITPEGHVVKGNPISTLSAESSTLAVSIPTRTEEHMTSKNATIMNSSMILDVSVPPGTASQNEPKDEVSVAINEAQRSRVVSPDESEMRERDNKEGIRTILHPKALYPNIDDVVVPRPRGMKRFDFSRHWRLNESQIRLCYDAGMEHFDQIMRTVRARDLVRELQDGFDLLRERGRGRYDMELPSFESPEYSFLTDIKSAPWMPLVREILGKEVVLIHKGMFLSLPGSEMQPYHQDGIHLTSQYQRPCHAINVFIPLVDLTASNGPTEFVLGSHILGHEDHDPDFIEVPKVPAGTPIIFDYRLGHRGLGNTSDFPRPIVYCTYAAAADGKEFRDSVNFSRKRYHRIGELVEKGLTREERANKRKQFLEDAALEQALAESKRLCTVKPSGA